MESMSRAPYALPRAREGYRMGHGAVLDVTIQDGLWDPYNDIHMGNAGDLCAREHDITRQVQDELAREYRRALLAQASGERPTALWRARLSLRRGCRSGCGRSGVCCRIDA